MHTALCLTTALLCSDPAALCSLLQGLLSALCLGWLQQRISCLFVFWANEGQLTLFNFPKEASTRQKLRAFLFLVDLFTLSMSTWAWLTNKMLLKDHTLLCPIEEWEMQALVTFYHCPSCVYFVSVKGLWVQRSVEARRGERGRRNWHRPFWENAENTRKREDARYLLFVQLCLAAL